jgi:pectin methylesterase-like acyl-CoA thioesterase
MQPAMVILQVYRMPLTVCLIKAASQRIIYIRNGIYREKIFIEKDFVSLVGEDKNKTQLLSHLHAMYGAVRIKMIGVLPPSTSKEAILFWKT